MRYLRDINIIRLLKMLCIVICTIVSLSACSQDENAQLGHGSDERAVAASQRFECPAPGGSKSILNNAQPNTDNQCVEGSKQCIQGSIIKIFYNSLGDMAITVYKQVTSEDLLSLMVLAFSLWMAFQILRHVSATSPESIGEFWTKILRKAALCFACGYLASTPANIIYAINTFVFPIYMTLLEFASAVLSLMSEKAQSLREFRIDGHVEPINFGLSDGGCSIPAGTTIQMSETQFPQQPLDMINCMACAVSDQLNAGYTIALRGLFGEGLFRFLVSLFLMAAFLIAKWGFALYLVDGIFRLVMMIIIMPFLILFYAFEQTRKWTTVGFKIILNSASVMLCMAILVSTTVMAINDLLTSDGDTYGNLDSYNNFGTVPLSMILIGFVVIKSTKLGVSLSDSLTGGGGNNSFQEKAAALIGTVAQYGFEAITAGFGKIATIAVNHSARLRAMQEKVQKARAKIARVKQAINHAAGRDIQKRGGQE